MSSAFALILFAFGIDALAPGANAGCLHGLKVVAVAVVAQAVWGMAKNLTPDAQRYSVAVGASIIAILLPNSWGQIAAILAGAVIGVLWLGAKVDDSHVQIGISLGKTVGTVSLVLFFSLLISLPLVAAAYPSRLLALFDSFYRSGSLVFGGGHVVLPLLQSEVVPTGWVSNDAFLAGYGAAQAVPGPLFTFAAYVGAIMGPEQNG